MKATANGSEKSTVYCALGPTLAAMCELKCKPAQKLQKEQEASALFLTMGKWRWHFPEPRFQAVGLADLR